MTSPLFCRLRSSLAEEHTLLLLVAVGVVLGLDSCVRSRSADSCVQKEARSVFRAKLLCSFLQKKRIATRDKAPYNSHRPCTLESRGSSRLPPRGCSRPGGRRTSAAAQSVPPLSLACACFTKSRQVVYRKVVPHRYARIRGRCDGCDAGDRRRRPAPAADVSRKSALEQRARCARGESTSGFSRARSVSLSVSLSASLPRTSIMWWSTRARLFGIFFSKNLLLLSLTVQRRSATLAGPRLQSRTSLFLWVEARSPHAKSIGRPSTF